MEAESSHTIHIHILVYSSIKYSFVAKYPASIAIWFLLHVHIHDRLQVCVYVHVQVCVYACILVHVHTVVQILASKFYSFGQSRACTHLMGSLALLSYLAIIVSASINSLRMCSSDVETMYSASSQESKFLNLILVNGFCSISVD